MKLQTAGRAANSNGLRRRIKWLLLALLVAGCLYETWCVFEFRAAEATARKLGWRWEYDSPWDAIRKDWKQAFRLGTWTECKRNLSVRNGRDLETHAVVLRRLSPRSLSVADASGLKELSTLEGLHGLQSLIIMECQSLVSIDALARHTQLRNLVLCGCRELRSFDVLGRLPDLELLGIIGGTQLTDVDFLKGLRKLRILDLSCCMNLADIGALNELQSLREFCFESCPKLMRFDAIKDRTNLVVMFLPTCFGASDQFLEFRAACRNVKVSRDGDPVFKLLFPLMYEFR